MTETTFQLASVAPRLARARDQFLEVEYMKQRWSRRYRSERLRLERLIAHRELQELRAGPTGSRRYVKRRADKLERARRELERLEQLNEQRLAA